MLCAGVDLTPALATLGVSADDTIHSIETACRRAGGSAAIPERMRKHLLSVGTILNIGWIAEGVSTPARIICQRSAFCPREPHCKGAATTRERPYLDDVKEMVLRANRA